MLDDLSSNLLPLFYQQCVAHSLNVAHAELLSASL